jgi:hypothetical protein
MTDNFFDFVGGTGGRWRVLTMDTLIGEPLLPISRLNVLPGNLQKRDEGLWCLKGFTSNVRYAERAEKEQLLTVQAGLGRPSATNAALIPIQKSAAWWELAQDERRKIFETDSKHTQTGLQYLPAIARKLYHCRDIGEPFDFLTWFEYAPTDSNAFDELVYRLRQSEEWQYVDREIDIRLLQA